MLSIIWFMVLVCFCGVIIFVIRVKVVGMMIVEVMFLIICRMMVIFRVGVMMMVRVLIVKRIRVSSSSFLCCMWLEKQFSNGVVIVQENVQLEISQVVLLVVVWNVCVSGLSMEDSMNLVMLMKNMVIDRVSRNRLLSFCEGGEIFWFMMFFLVE